MNKRYANQRLTHAVRMICARRSGLSVPAVALLGFGMVSVAFADPTGGVVVSGAATISTPAAGTTVIDQSSQSVQLNWNTFDVAANESVRFQQPSSSAVALNRILDQNPSQIFGRIDANGQVILVNPNGILFGHSAQLNVGSLVASSLDVIGFDAATGRYTFGTSRADVGAIVNDGAITAAGGGSVTLLGGRVTNTGSIVADFGTVNLAAGRAATLDLAGDGLLRLEVDGELLSNNSGASAAVENSGVIEANGGQVLLTAQAIDDVFANLVNNTGVVRANRIDDSGGTIRLMGAGGTVRSSGVLDASAGDAVSSGGTVEMLGEQVGLFGAALVDVSGATSGGTALIGGDYQGKNPNVLNASRTYVSADASIVADAGLVGDGGRVIVWADEITRFNGSISARGGSLSGNGGFAEVSGKGTLLFRGSANLSATNGFAGQLLLDPRNIIVATGGESELEGDTGDDGDANTYAFAEDVGDDITVAPTTITDILDTGTTVTLQAHNDITVTNAIDGSASATPGGGLILDAGDDIFINADVRTNGGAIQLTAGSNAATPVGADAPTGELTLAAGVTLSAGGAAVTLNSDSNMQLLGTVSGNSIVATSGGSLTVGTLNAGTGNVNLHADDSLSDDGNNSTRITGGALTLTAGTGIGTTGTTGQIDTNVASLTANVGFGSVYIGELNGLTLTNVAAGGGGNDVVVTSTTGDIVVNTVSALDEVWLNASAGSITDDNNNATRISGGALTLLAGSAIGAAGATGQIDTTATSLTAIAGSGGVYIGESNGLTLTTVSAGGFSNDVEVTSTTGDIVVNQVSASDAVTLTATAGAITDDSNNGTSIAAQVLTLTAGTAIGATGTDGQIDTNVSALTATANNGGVYIGEWNGLTLTDVRANGGGNVAVTSTAGNIVVNAVSAFGAVSLTATNGAITDDGNDASVINGGSVSLSAATNLGTVVDFAAANAADVGSSLDVQTFGALTASVQSTVGQINLNISGAPTLATGAITLGSGSNRAGAIVLQSAGNLNATGFATGAINIGANNTTRVGLRSGSTLILPAGGGFTDQPADRLLLQGAQDIVDADGTPHEFSLAASTLDFRSGGLSGATILNTNVGVLSASIGNNQNLTVNEANDVTLGTLNVGTGTVTLTAGGAVVDDGDDLTRIVASTATLSGSSLGASGNALDTQVNTLSASATSGGVYINEADALALTVSATGGAADVRTTNGSLTVTSASGNGVTLIAGGAGSGITLNGAVNAGAGDVTLTAGTAGNRGAIVAGFGSQVTGGAFTATGSAVGTSGARLNTTVASLNATSTNGGIFITETDALSLTANATGGAVDVQATNGAMTVASASGAAVTLTTGGAGNGITLNGAVNATAGDVTLSTGGAGSDIALNGAASTVAGDVTLTAGGDGSGITLNSTVNAGTGDVTLTAGTAANRGAIVAGAGNQITGGSFTATGAAIGTSAARLNTSVGSLNATSTNGGIFVIEADALNLTASATNGTADVRTTNGALTVTSVTGDGVTLATSGAGNAITLNGAVNAAAGDVTVTTGGAGSGITLNGTVNATAGDVALTAGGGVTLNGSVSAVTGDVTVTAGGAGSGITVNSAVNAGTGNVTLTAGTTTNRGAIVAGAGNQITGGSLTATGSAIGTNAARLNTTVASLNATSTNGGIFVTEADAFNLIASATNGAADVRTTNGALTVTSVTGDGVTLITGGDGNGITLNGAVNAVAGDVTLTAGGAGGGITLNGAVNAGAGDVTLTVGTVASRGAIVAGAGNQITGGSLTATGSALGTSAARLNTTVASLNATSTNGGIFVTETDALNLTASPTNGAADVRTTNGALTVTSVTGDEVTLTAGGAGNDITLNGTANALAGDVTLTAGGGITLNGAASAAAGDVTLAAGGDITLNAAVNAVAGDVTITAGGTGSGITLNSTVNAGTGDVTLTAGTTTSRGAIVAGAGNQITAGSLTATGSTLGSSAARLNTSVSALNATTTNGGVFVDEVDALNLTANAAGGAVDVRTGNGSLTVAAASGNGVTLIAGGAGSGITLNGAVNAGTGDVALTAGTTASRGSITGTAGHSISGRSLTATAAAIGASNARLNTSIDTLTAVASTGDVYISEQNGLTLANVSAAHDIDVTSITGDIVVNTMAAANNATLAASSGAITDDGDDSTRLSANALTLNARSIGAASTVSGTTLNSTARLDTNVTTLTATATAGGIFIDEANGLQNVNVQASGGTAGDIELLTLAGDLILQQVSASDTLLLAAGRNIFAAPGASAITARVAELRAGTTDVTGGQIGSLSDLLELQLSSGNSLRLFVPQTIDPNDPNRAPATLPSAGVTTTLNLFGSQSALASKAGFNQFQGLGETQFTSPAEALVKNLQSQTATVQAGLDIDWVSFDSDVSLFGTLEPSVCLPGDQRDEESSTPEC